jgi:hypothetical protein
MPGPGANREPVFHPVGEQPPTSIAKTWETRSRDYPMYSALPQPERVVLRFCASNRASMRHSRVRRRRCYAEPPVIPDIAPDATGIGLAAGQDRQGCQFSGWCWANFSNRIIAKKFGTAKPHGVTWKAAGGCAIFSQTRQVNLSRTVWITFHWRGITAFQRVCCLNVKRS